MSDLSKLTALVRDGGSFIGVARRLAKDFGRVLYAPTYRQNNPDFNEYILGDGCGDIEHCPDLWLAKEEVDVFVFCDVGFEGEQAELRDQGYYVWGGGPAMMLETDREFFLNKLEELGLDVPQYEIIVGTTALRAFLKDREDIFIKVSKFRRSWETYHWRSLAQDGHMLPYWEVKFGGKRETIRFLCFDKIETTLEIGGDTYNVAGQWPQMMSHGLEAKDEALFSAITKRPEMPEELTHIMDAFTPFLTKCGGANQMSFEVRVTDIEAFWIDSTNRGGLPSTASFLKAKNVSEVIYAGAQGELVEIDYGFKFSAECMVKIKSADGVWGTIVLPDELKDEVLLADYCEEDGQPWFPADDAAICEVGWLVATGDTPTEVAKRMNELADLLPDGADASVEALAEIIREIESEHEQGIKFTDQPLPDPEIVLAPSK